MKFSFPFVEIFLEKHLFLQLHSGSCASNLLVTFGVVFFQVFLKAEKYHFIQNLESTFLMDSSFILNLEFFL